MRHALRYARGFSLLELVVVVVAVAILTGVALDRLLPLVGRAQRAAFLRVQGDLQSALLLEAADRITRGEARLALERRKAWHGERSKNAEDRDHDHELDQGKTALTNVPIHCSAPP